MSNESAIELGQHLTALLTTGKRTTTYKFALAMALMDYSIEHLPNDPKAPLTVSIKKLADYVIGYYWNQVEMYDDEVEYLFHGSAKHKKPTITRAIRDFKDQHSDFKNVERARESLAQYSKLVNTVAVALAENPIPRLQTIGKNAYTGSQVLYDTSWTHDNYSKRALDSLNWELVLLPGVAWSLAHLSQLLRPFIEMQWQNDLVNFNKAHLKNDRLSEFLWGTSRTNVAVLAQDLTELQAGYCFYCETKLNTKKIHVDHVLPWSRFLINGVSNLVATDDKCNLNKSDNLPVQKHIQNALDRNLGDLNVIANKRNFAVMRDSTQLIATNIYKITPAGTPLWVGRGKDPQPHTIPA